MSKTLISVNNISLSRDQKTILDQVSFELTQGGFITLIGPNGAGKSSLIKVLIGLIKPDQGQVVKASDIRIGYMPQSFTPNEYIPISVQSFLTLNQSTDTAAITQTAKLCGVDALLNASLQSLSGGEMQRVLLTRALLGKPDVLILDEPAQNLDVNGQMQLYQLIQDVHQQYGCSVLMVSHDLHRVMKESTQVLCLYHHICCMGQPEVVLKDSQFNDLFADQMGELMASYEHHHNHCHQD